MALKKSKVHSTLKKTNEVLKKGVEKGNLSEIQKCISTELFNVLSSSPISVDRNLYSIMYGIQNNLTKIKEKDYVEGLISDIKFDAPININSREIKNTGELQHQDVITTSNSIKQIEDSQTELSSLEENVSALKDRFNDNISLLRKIADEQVVFKRDPRGLNDINEDLNKYGTVKDNIGKRIKIFSDMINIFKQNNGEGDGSATSEEWKKVLSGEDKQQLEKLLDDFNAIDSDGIYSASIEFSPSTCGWQITSIRNVYEIIEEQKIYISLSKEVDKRIKELEHEKTLRELIDSLGKEEISIPNGFLPFSSNDTVAKVGSNNVETIGYANDFVQRLRELDNFKKEIKKIHKRYNTNKNSLNSIHTLQQFQEKINGSADFDKFQKELLTIIDICKNNLLLGSDIYKASVGKYDINLGGSLENPIELNFIDGYLPPSARIANYSLCDEKGNPIGETAKGFSISKFQVKGISFDDTNQTMLINNIEIDPIEGVKFPLNFNLNVKVNIKDNDTGLNVEHLKPLHLIINSPKLPQANRKNAYENITDPTMDKRIEEKYDDKYRESLENEIIWKIVRKGGNKSEMNKIYNDELQRDLFIERIRKRLENHFPFLELTKLKKGFKEDMIKESKNVPVQYLISEDAFKNYIKSSREDDLKDYATKEIEKSLSDDQDIIDSILLSFYGSTQLSDGHKKRSSSDNYTRFLIGRNAEGDSAGNKVKVEVQGINKILAKITIGRTEEKIETQSHDQLIEHILSKEHTRDGTIIDESTKCKLALCVLKAMVEISPKKLSKQIKDKEIESVMCNRIEIDIDGSGNLRYRGSKVDTKTQNKQYVNIFDESTIDWNKTKEIKNDIQMISMQINSILNGLAQDYQEATSTKNIKNMFLLRYDTTSRLRSGPIKRLWSRTNYNFDFDGVIIKDLHGKNINISFKEGKFVVEGEFDGENYKYEAKDLGYILRQGKEAFRGVELEIFSKINEKYIEQLRTNKLIQKESFAIADLNENRTGRVYIYSGGHLSYLEIADEKLNPLGPNRSVGRIDSKNIPGARTLCTPEETKEFFQNPLLAGRLLREMRKMLKLLAPRKISRPNTKSTKKTGALKSIGDRFSAIGKKIDSLKPKH